MFWHFSSYSCESGGAYFLTSLLGSSQYISVYVIVMRKNVEKIETFLEFYGRFLDIFVVFGHPVVY